MLWFRCHNHIYKATCDVLFYFSKGILQQAFQTFDAYIEVGYTEPFSALLDPNIFILKREYEKSVQAQKDRQPKSAAHLSLMNLISTTQAQVKNFFTAGLSKVFLVRISALNLKNIKTALAQRSAILNRSLTHKVDIVNPEKENIWGDDVKIVHRCTPNRKPITPAEKDDFVEKYSTGASMGEIARLYKCHHTTVGRILRAKGVTIRG